MSENQEHKTWIMLKRGHPKPTYPELPMVTDRTLLLDGIWNSADGHDNMATTWTNLQNASKSIQLTNPRWEWNGLYVNGDLSLDLPSFGYNSTECLFNTEIIFTPKSSNSGTLLAFDYGKVKYSVLEKLPENRSFELQGKNLVHKRNGSVVATYENARHIKVCYYRIFKEDTYDHWDYTEWYCAIWVDNVKVLDSYLGTRGTRTNCYPAFLSTNLNNNTLYPAKLFSAADGSNKLKALVNYVSVYKSGLRASKPDGKHTWFDVNIYTNSANTPILLDRYKA